MKERKAVESMTTEELWEEVLRSRVELDRLRLKSRAHKNSLKEQQRALLERNSQIAYLDAALNVLIPVGTPPALYLERDADESLHEEDSHDSTKPLTYKVT